MAGGGGGRARRGAGGGADWRGGCLIDLRPREASLYLSSHRCSTGERTKKEIGFADFDPFVFGQRPALRAG